jgi:polyphosphate kinase 2 (PPK2 family)
MLSDIDLSRSIPEKDKYRTELVRNQNALQRLGSQVYLQQLPVVIVLEGWETAGAAGILKRLVEPLDPRIYTVHAISTPTNVEAAHHFLWRFWQRVPAAGKMVVFDHSWYGRLLADRVAGRLPEPVVQQTIAAINAFERQLSDFGTQIFKFWLHIGQQEQLRRLEERAHSLHNDWKSKAAEGQTGASRPDFERAVEQMLQETSPATATWTIVEAQDKWYARIKVLSTLVSGLSKALNYDPFEQVQIRSTESASKSGRGKKKKKK